MLKNGHVDDFLFELEKESRRSLKAAFKQGFSNINEENMFPGNYPAQVY